MLRDILVPNSSQDPLQKTVLASQKIEMASQTALHPNSFAQLRQLFQRPASVIALRTQRTGSRTSDTRQRAPSSRRMSSIIQAASATALPDIDERLSRYEWDRMNLPDLTGDSLVWPCCTSNSQVSFDVSFLSPESSILPNPCQIIVLLNLDRENTA